MKVTRCFWKYYEKWKETLTANQILIIKFQRSHDQIKCQYRNKLSFLFFLQISSWIFILLHWINSINHVFNCVKGKIWTKWLFMTMSKRKMHFFYLLSDFAYYFLSILFKNHISRKLQCFGMIVMQFVEFTVHNILNYHWYSLPIHCSSQL